MGIMRAHAYPDDGSGEIVDRLVEQVTGQVRWQESMSFLADKGVTQLVEIGADEVINYTDEDIADRVKELTDGQGVDVVLDHVGADFWPAAIASLAKGGRYGICGVTTGYRAELQMGMIFTRHQTVFGAAMGRKEDMLQIVEMAGRGVIRGVIHQTFPLQDAVKAHEVMEGLSFFGKLVLTVP